jgi:hypothetical protein
LRRGRGRLCFLSVSRGIGVSVRSFILVWFGLINYLGSNKLTCIETKHEYALYAQLSTRPETMKQTIRTRSAHLVETSAERWDLTFPRVVVGPGGDEWLPLTLWLPSRGPSRYEYLW